MTIHRCQGGGGLYQDKPAAIERHTCSVCGWYYTLTKAGNIRKHMRFSKGRSWVCLGSGQPPKAQP